MARRGMKGMVMMRTPVMLTGTMRTRTTTMPMTIMATITSRTRALW